MSKAFLKKLAIIAAGGCIATSCIYTGNEEIYHKIVMPSLHKIMSPENSHAFGIMAAKYSLIPACKVEDGKLLKTSLWGLDFPNPVGIAAGLDKNAEAAVGLFRCGVGFVEVGTVTPKPQDGNPKPRIFEVVEEEALINRCGFNNRGHQFVKNQLQNSSKNGKIIGVNIGKNKTTEVAEQDYVLGIETFCDVADYVTINISSPNTPGLRTLQKGKALETLLDKVLAARERCDKKPPILLKIAPDLSLEEKQDIAAVIMRKGKTIDGLIVSNTTLSRPEQSNTVEAGGWSGGRHLREMSTEAVRQMYQLTKGQIPIIGVGGISSGADAYAKIKAGASLVQVYTAIAYRGPPVIGKIKRELKELLVSDGYTNLQEAVGADHR